MIDINNLKREIIDSLVNSNVEKVILFGSYAYGTPNSNSDIDLYIVTKDDYLPQTWKEKNELYLKISRELRGIRKKIPLDLIVHSKKMYSIFQQTNSSFYKNDIMNGIKLIWK